MQNGALPTGLEPGSVVITTSCLDCAFNDYFQLVRFTFITFLVSSNLLRPLAYSFSYLTENSRQNGETTGSFG